MCPLAAQMKPVTSEATATHVSGHLRPGYQDGSSPARDARMSKSHMAVRPMTRVRQPSFAGINRDAHATRDGMTLSPRRRSSQSSVRAASAIATPQRMPPRKERIAAPYAMSANCNCGLSVPLAKGIASERQTKGMTPDPPSQRADFGSPSFGVLSGPAGFTARPDCSPTKR